jgi:hypothetical protein
MFSILRSQKRVIRAFGYYAVKRELSVLLAFTQSKESYPCFWLFRSQKRVIRAFGYYAVKRELSVLLAITQSKESYPCFWLLFQNFS